MCELGRKAHVKVRVDLHVHVHALLWVPACIHVEIASLRAPETSHGGTGRAELITSGSAVTNYGGASGTP